MDADLTARLARTSRGYPAALAVIRPDGTEVARHRCGPDDDFEIGSITKGVTGLLYHDALARGEVRPGTTLGDLLPLAGSAAGEITLAAVATHRSGLPRMLGGHLLRRSLDYLRHGHDPFDQPLDELYATARTTRLRPGRARYSNAGYQLFGQALAAAAGVPYGELVRDRVARPLGLDPFYVPHGAAELRATALDGHNRGRVVDPWASGAIGPAGGVRASITAMAGFARALLDGTAPGIAALDPVADFAGPAMRIGAGWMTTNARGRGPLTWHNGGTGGFRSWLGLRRDLGLGVVVLVSTTRAADPLGLSLFIQLVDNRPLAG